MKTDWLNKICFNPQGLVPVVVQDVHSGEVLMLAYANQEALEKTLETGYGHYYSRSRKKLWKKGETSGHLQKIREIFIDCDQDAVVYRVVQQGNACHTGNRTCFFEKVY